MSDDDIKVPTRSRESDKLRALENIEVEMSVEVGRTEISISDLLRLNEGSVVELDRLAGEPLDILVNGTMIAKGEVVMVGERFGIRFSDIVDPEKRVETLYAGLIRASHARHSFDSWHIGQRVLRIENPRKHPIKQLRKYNLFSSLIFI